MTTVEDVDDVEDQHLITSKIFPPFNGLHIMMHKISPAQPNWAITVLSETSHELLSYFVQRHFENISSLELQHVTDDTITFSNGISLDLQVYDPPPLYWTYAYSGNFIFQLLMQNKLSTLDGIQKRTSGLLAWINLPNGHIGSLYVGRTTQHLYISLIDHTIKCIYESVIDEHTIAPDDDIGTIKKLISNRLKDGSIGDNIRMQPNAFVIDISDGIVLNELAMVNTVITRQHLCKLFENEYLTFVEELDLCFK